MKCNVRLVALLALSAALLGCSGNGDSNSTPLVPKASINGPTTTGSRAFAATPSVVDLKTAGYVEEEFFIEGTARAFKPEGTWGIDGKWPVVETTSAPYKTRILVRRPVNPQQFSGVVITEWFNVTSNIDIDVDYQFLQQEILRSGHVWVGVTAQAVSISSTGDGSLGKDALGLKAWDPVRYGSLQHPGDAYSYDIFSQVGAMLKNPGTIDPLRGLTPKVLLADGESQSAFRLLTYVNAIHKQALVYDGFLIHSRNGTGAPIAAGIPVPAPAQVRTDLMAPVFQFITESDLFKLGTGNNAFPPARQPDSPSVHTWEVAGTAHSDRYSVMQLAKQGNMQFDSFIDLSRALAIINSAPQHLVMNAALRSLVRWVQQGARPTSAPSISTQGETVVRDARGNALGGVRLPFSDVPIAVLSGEGPIGFSGLTVPFDEATLKALYPTADVYVQAVTTAAQAAVAKGFLLAADAQALIDAAKDNPPVK